MELEDAGLSLAYKGAIFLNVERNSTVRMVTFGYCISFSFILLLWQPSPVLCK
jgi:hypothetical protein